MRYGAVLVRLFSKAYDKKKIHKLKYIFVKLSNRTKLIMSQLKILNLISFQLCHDSWETDDTLYLYLVYMWFWPI